MFSRLFFPSLSNFFILYLYLYKYKIPSFLVMSSEYLFFMILLIFL